MGSNKFFLLENLENRMILIKPVLERIQVLIGHLFFAKILGFFQIDFILEKKFVGSSSKHFEKGLCSSSCKFLVSETTFGQLPASGLFA